MTDEQTAVRLAELSNDPNMTITEMVSIIVRALQAAYANGFTNGHTVGINHEDNREVLRMCHEARMMNGIVDYSDPKATGVVRKVLGTLPVTADGCVVGVGVHSRYYIYVMSQAIAIQREGSTMTHDDWYSSFAAAQDAIDAHNKAAEAAKEGKA